MSEEFLNNNLPAGIDAQLDQLLGDWRARHQLDSSKVEAIRASITASPAAFAFPNEWWEHHLAYLQRVLAQAQQTQRTSASAARRWFVAEGKVGQASNWQPYLKLVSGS